MVRELRRGVNMLNSKLVKLLKQRDRNAHKIQENFNVLTALLQAVSQKRSNHFVIFFRITWESVLVKVCFEL